MLHALVIETQPAPVREILIGIVVSLVTCGAIASRLKTLQVGTAEFWNRGKIGSRIVLKSTGLQTSPAGCVTNLSASISKVPDTEIGLHFTRNSFGTWTSLSFEFLSESYENLPLCNWLRKGCPVTNRCSTTRGLWFHRFPSFQFRWAWFSELGVQPRLVSTWASRVSEWGSIDTDGLTWKGITMHAFICVCECKGVYVNVCECI